MPTEILGEGPQQSLSAERRWRFGKVLLDERSLELVVDGAIVKIDRKPLQVLLVFLHHVGKVVTKDALQEKVWPGRILSETVLAKTISVLRQAIGDYDKSIITTAHKFGYRLVAEVKVETTDVSMAPPLKLAPGTRLSWKPNWALESRLGGGGSGEVWLARHEKTFEPLVVKFPRTGPALSSFRREVTLARVLSESLGARAPVAQVKDWNLDRPPYYLEVEYVEGRDLGSWAESLGGLDAIPLATRLEVVTHLAEALAAAHSVGVLHKDLKPGNVLIQPNAMQPVKLCDFGSGALLEPGQLERLKITELHPTENQAGGTALYLAPELFDGQPPTARSDLYSLGVILFQMIAGSFQKALAPGWESLIPDPLLIEDIQAAAAGDPQLRMANAKQLADRLRTLAQRRLQRQVQLDADAKAERLRQAAVELKRVRRYAIAMLALTLSAAAGATVAFSKSQEAARANATSTAVNNFLTEDVLGIDPAVERPRDASYQSLLEKAAAKIDERFAEQPDAAATLHYVLGRRFQDIGQLPAALAHYQKAAGLEVALHGEDSDMALLADERYANSLFTASRFSEAFALFDRLTAICTRTHGALDLSTLFLRARVARLMIVAGQYLEAENILRDVVSQAPQAQPPSEDTRILYRDWAGLTFVNDAAGPSGPSAMQLLLTAQAQGTLGALLAGYTGDYAEAEQLLRSSNNIQAQLALKGGELAAENNLMLSYALASQQRFDEAAQSLREANLFFDRWLPEHHYLRSAPAHYASVAFLHEGRWNNALEAARNSLAICTSAGCPRVLSEEARYTFGLALMAAGHAAEALEPLRASLRSLPEALANTQEALSRRISLAECLLLVGSSKEALAEMMQIDEADLQQLPRTDHLLLGEYHRVRGLLLAKLGRRSDAVSSLADAQRIFTKRLTATHWKTQRVVEELRKLQKS